MLFLAGYCMHFRVYICGSNKPVNFRKFLFASYIGVGINI